MKNFLLSFIALILVISLSTFAKDSFSFEPEEYEGDSVPLSYIGMAPFFTWYRDSDPEDYSVVEGEESWHGTHAVQMRLTRTGTKWNIICQNHYLRPADTMSKDTTFLQDLNYGDTIYYYLYIPLVAPIDSLFVFVRNVNWTHDEHTVYHASDLSFGGWNELKDGISDDFPMVDSVIQSDFEIHTTPYGANPACTLYWDCPSSLGPMAGISMPEQKNNAVSVAKNSINCVKYTLNGGKPVILQIFDLTGRKVSEMVPGFQTAGSYEIDLTSLSPGVYIARVVAGIEVEIGKVICVK